MIEVCTYNTSLKHRLTRFAEQYPAECHLIDDDGLGCMTFEVSKGRLGFRLTAPYSDDRRTAISNHAKKSEVKFTKQNKTIH